MPPKQNRALTQSVFEGLAKGDLSAAQAVLGTKLKKNGVASAKQAGDVFPDLKIQLDDTIAEGDKVVVRWSASGTHRGAANHPLFGAVKGTGRSFTVSGITILRFDDTGKVVETFGLTDELGVARQLGLVRQRG
jgi:predicted ester cyclase